MTLKRGTLTINGKEYSLNPILTAYIQACSYGTLCGGLIGSAMGCTVVAAMPFVLGGLGTRLLVRSLLTKIK